MCRLTWRGGNNITCSLTCNTLQGTHNRLRMGHTEQSMAVYRTARKGTTWTRRLALIYSAPSSWWMVGPFLFGSDQDELA